MPAGRDDDQLRIGAGLGILEGHGIALSTRNPSRDLRSGRDALL